MPKTQNVQELSRNFYPDGTPLNRYDAMVKVREFTDTILLSFSRGKDSIALWLYLRELDMFNIVPFYAYGIPGLKYQEDSLAYYEDFFQTPIIRVAHPSLTLQLNELVHQAPERCKVIEAARLFNFDFDDLSDELCNQRDLPASTFQAVGVRAADSLMRRTACKMYGPIRWKKQKVWAIWDMSRKDVFNIMAQYNCKLPQDYALFARSQDGIQLQYIRPIMYEYPDDYLKILEWFPMAELEYLRYGLYDDLAYSIQLRQSREEQAHG